MAIDGGRPSISHHVRLGIQDDEVLLRRGLPVQTSDGRRAGALDHLVVEPANMRVTHLVVQRGWLWNRQARIVPLERAAAITDYGVRLNMGAEELDQAPLYQPPAGDAQIAVGLQRSLDTDPRTRSAGLSVSVQDGVVRLIGSVRDEVMDAARAIARRMRGVIGFDDEVAAPPVPSLRIGAPVYARDGRYGTLDKVVVDPHARRVTHVVVRQGWLLTEDRVIPIERVERAEPDGVYLDAPAAALDKYPRYREEIFAEPIEDWEWLEPYSAADVLFWGGPYMGVAPPVVPVVEHVVATGVPEDEIVLRRGADVVYEDGLVGSLDHILIDPTNAVVTHLVVQEYGSDRRVIVPAQWVRELRGEAVVLKRWNPYQPGVPAYEAARDDTALAADLRARLRANPALGAVQVQVDRGVARLMGNVPTIGDKAEADAIARDTPGVIDVDNTISADSALVGRVAAELSADRFTALIPIEVIADRGVVTLEGTVPTPQVKAAAEAIARRVPGVITVINELEIRRPEPKPVPVPCRLGAATLRSRWIHRCRHLD